VRTLIAGLALAATLFAAAPALSQDDVNSRSKDDPVVYFAPDDKAMNAAMAEAKTTLSHFWLLLGSDEIVAETGSVKIAFPVKGGGKEYMWVGELRRDKGVIRGVLNNTPEMDVGVREGDAVVVKPEDVVDWIYVRNGKMYGGYTIRVMLKDLPPARAQEMDELLSDRPLEGDQI